MAPPPLHWLAHDPCLPGCPVARIQYTYSNKNNTFIKAPHLQADQRKKRRQFSIENVIWDVGLGGAKNPRRKQDLKGSYYDEAV